MVSNGFGESGQERGLKDMRIFFKRKKGGENQDKKFLKCLNKLNSYPKKIL